MLYQFSLSVRRSERNTFDSVSAIFNQAIELYDLNRYGRAQVSQTSLIVILQGFSAFPQGVADFVRSRCGLSHGELGVGLYVRDPQGNLVPTDYDTDNEGAQTLAIINIGLLNNPLVPFGNFERGQFQVLDTVRTSFPDCVSFSDVSIRNGEYLGDAEPTAVLTLWAYPSVVREVVRHLLEVCTQECIPYFIPATGEAVLSYPENSDIVERFSFDAQYFLQ